MHFINCCGIWSFAPLILPAWLRLSPSFVCKLWSRFACKCAWSALSARDDFSSGVVIGDGSLEAERDVSFGGCALGFVPWSFCPPGALFSTELNLRFCLCFLLALTSTSFASALVFMGFAFSAAMRAE